MTGLDDLGVDPSTPGFFLRSDYFEVLDRLRTEAPVYEYAPGVKAVSRYHDIRAISRDPARFCSGRGVLANDPLREGGTIAGSILHMDPPRHNAWRRILNREFTGRAVGRIEGRIRAQAADLIDGLPRHDPFDLVSTLTAPLPVLVICELLGVPESARSDFRRWSDATILASDGRSSLGPEAEASVMELVGFLDQLAKDKAVEPAGDIISLLVDAEVEGRKLTAGELVTFSMSLVVAGNETTRHLMSSSLMELAARPLAREAISDDLDRIPGVVEECLRWVTPIQQFARTATEEPNSPGFP